MFNLTAEALIKAIAEAYVNRLFSSDSDTNAVLSKIGEGLAKEGVAPIHRPPYASPQEKSGGVKAMILKIMEDKNAVASKSNRCLQVKRGLTSRQVNMAVKELFPGRHYAETTVGQRLSSLTQEGVLGSVELTPTEKVETRGAWKQKKYFILV